MDSLSNKQRKAVSMLASGSTHQQTGKALKVRRETVWRWNQDPAFQLHLRSKKAENQQAWSDRLSNLVTAAVDALEDVVTDKTASPNARIQAAREILDRVTPPERTASSTQEQHKKLACLSLNELETLKSISKKVRMHAAREPSRP